MPPTITMQSFKMLPSRRCFPKPHPQNGAEPKETIALKAIYWGGDLALPVGIPQRV